MRFSILESALLQLPFWLLGVGILAVMLGACFLGLSVRRWHDRVLEGTGTEDTDAHEGYVISAVLGLLALLTGFTFALALDRFDTRRDRLLDEANAITSTYFQTQLLEEPHRSRISHLLSDYTDARVELGGRRRAHDSDVLQRSNHLIVELWKATAAAFPTIKQYDFSSTYVGSVSLLIDESAGRDMARQAHVPSEVYLVLIVYQAITALVIGYVLIGKRGRISAIVLLVLFSMSLLLIIDVDRPASGWIRESQEPMLGLQTFLRANPPSTFGPSR